MSDITSTLTLAVDSTQVNSATTALSKFAATGTPTSAVADGLNKTGAAANVAAAGVKAVNPHLATMNIHLAVLAARVAAGESPLTALARHGMLLSEAASNASAALGVTGAAAVGVLGGIVAVVAAIGGFATAMALGAKENNDFQKSLILTGNAAGLTQGKLKDLADSVAQSSGSTITSVRATAEGLAASGRFTSETFDKAVAAAVAYERATGTSAKDTVKAFTEMADGVSKWATENNKQYALVNSAQLEAIKSAERQGDTQKALTIVLDASMVRFAVAGQQLTTFGKILESVTGWFSKMWQAAKYQGAPTALEDQIAQVQAALDKANKPTGSVFDYSNKGDPQKQALMDRLALLKSQLDIQNKQAAADEKTRIANAAQLSFDAEHEKHLSQETQRARELEDVAAKFSKVDPTPSNVKKLLSDIADINEKYKGKGTGLVDRVQLRDDIAVLQAGLAQITDSYDASDKILDALHSAQLVSDADYYAQKNKNLQAYIPQQIAELQAETTVTKAQAKNAVERIAAATKEQENNTKIAKLRMQAGLDNATTSIKERDLVLKVATAYEAARVAAQDYLDTITRTGERTLSGMGIGDAARAEAASLQKVEDDYRTKINALQSQLLNKTITPEAFAAQLAQEKDFHDKEIAEQDRVNKAIAAKQTEWTVGASDALANYLEKVRNVSKSTEDLWTNSFNSIEDALTSMVKNGTADWKGLITTMISEAFRLYVIRPILGNAFSMLSGLIGGGGGDYASTLNPVAGSSGSFPHMAGGGTIQPGSWAMVGEAGPEMIQGPANVTPMNKMGGFSYVDNRTLNFGAGVSRNELLAGMTIAQNAAVSRIKEAVRRGAPGVRAP